VLPSSPWPELRERGYSLQWIEDGQRILPREYREEMTVNSDGSHGILTPGHTQPTTMIVHHAGIQKTKRFSFPAP
jgi:hypothetical protein